MRVFGRTEFGGARGRGEVVVVARYVADCVERPFLCGTPTDICLVVEVLGVVLSLCVLCAKQILGCLVPDGMCHGEPAVAVAYVGRRSHHRRRSRRLELVGTLVGDVEDARHLVAVLRLEASGGELDTLHHVGIDDGESLLLSRPDEQRTVHLDAVDVHGVLVERPAPDIILVGQFVVRAYSRLCGYDLLYSLSRRVSHVLHVTHVDRVHGTCLLPYLPHFHFPQLVSRLWQHHVEQYGVRRILQCAFAGLVADHGEHHDK